MVRNGFRPSTSRFPTQTGAIGSQWLLSAKVAFGFLGTCHAKIVSEFCISLTKVPSLMLRASGICGSKAHFVRTSRSPSRALLSSFSGEGSPTKIDNTEKNSWYPYSNLSTGGSSRGSPDPWRPNQVSPGVRSGAAVCWSGGSPHAAARGSLLGTFFGAKTHSVLEPIRAALHN